MPLDIGTRVTVYWSDDDEWYKGTVVALEPDDDTFLLIEYDDGTIDSIDTTSTKFRSSSKPNKFLKHDTKALIKQRERIATLNIGSRISIWWPAEKEYYTGTLTQILEEEGDNISPNDNRPHHITYDDGDEGWLNLIHRKFKPVEPKVGRLQVGSRVAVYDDHKKRNCLCTVTKIKLKRVRPHQVMYDDERNGKEWINLNVQPFLDIGPRPGCTVVDPAAPVNANTLKKRKTQFLKPQPPDDTRELKRTKINVEKSEETSPSKCQEICGICKSLAKRPRAMSCHHIFCKRCIKDKDQKSEGMCPLCEFPLNKSTLFKFDPEHVSFRAVEALEPTTTQVLKTYSSASAASLESRQHFIPSYIINACQSKRRDDRAYNGYFWRFQGSKDRILRVGESIKDGIPIEQLDPETLVVINVFPSSRKANEGTKVSRCAIRRVLERRGTSTAGGFFWRLQGETHGPWPDPEPTNLNPVEQLDFETGDVLNSYISLAEAKRAMGMRPNSACIREVCDGIGRATAQGYFWRWKGSKSLPNHMMGVQKIVQIRKTKGGSVVKEFRTSREAEAYFQHRFTWSHVCRCCREKVYFNGYYWQYRMLRERKSTDEQVIGKRLRVQPAGDTEGEWLEGKINSFDPATGRHEIIYDTGTIEYHALEEIHYEWKNDQGQKPVEKLDLRSGQILVTFDSISDAAASIRVGLPETKTQIVAVLKGKTRSCYGFFWRYKGSDALPRKSKAKRKVEQLCLNTGGVLRTFDSIAEGAKALGISTPGISYCCNGRNSSKSAGGFGWRFSTVEE